MMRSKNKSVGLYCKNVGINVGLYYNNVVLKILSNQFGILYDLTII